MGTMIEAANPSAEDYGGHAGCNAVLNITRPKLIASILDAYLEAGADIISTNTFGASSVALADYGLASKTKQINRCAVAIAKKAAQTATTKAHPRFVAGEIGPTSKLPTLGHISFEDLFASYTEQIKIFLEGKVDCILIATCQDPLQMKAAGAAARKAMSDKGSEVPLFVSVTIENNGTMLLGTDLLAALATIDPFRPSAFGINCARGPDMMLEYIEQLALHSPFPILCRPNAGMPENVAGKPVYPLTPADFADSLKAFVDDFGVAFVGGCCGTTPDHIHALVSSLKTRSKRQEARGKMKTSGLGPHASCFAPQVSGLFSAVSLDQEPRPFIVAEQTNVNGSKRFKELLLKNDYDGMASMGKESAKGAHALDICVAYPGRNECEDIVKVISRIVKTVDSPIMIDSTNPKTIKAALEISPGRSIINSISLEDGGVKAMEILKLAERFGAAVVCMTIDEEGMARTAKRKLDIAKRLHEIALSCGLRTEDLLFDPLTFTIASGDASLNNASVETIKGIELIKEKIPRAKTILGVSNVSYGLPPAARRVLTSIFLQRALDAGLDAAIVNPSGMLRLSQIPTQERKIVKRLIDNDISRGPPLVELLGHYEAKTGRLEHARQRFVRAAKHAMPASDALRQKILNGDKSGLETLLNEACKTMNAADVINKILLPAMKRVGDLFARGGLPLPFVLQSAEAMRAAIDELSPMLAKNKAGHKGTIVLATLRGDVHDIGKNLVDIILSNNGFEVINLGIRQPIEAIIDASRKHNADAIGLSGLLVSSTEIMREDLETLRHREISIPVLVGGAALTKKFADTVLQKAYEGPVHYCKDAFAGLAALEEIVKRRN